MEAQRRIRFVRTDIWREGKWLDLWSVVHFLSGISVAFGIALFGFELLAASLIAFLMLVAYELWEAMVQIHETPQNRVMDVVVGMTSFFLAHAIGLPIAWSTTFFIAFGVILAINIGLSAIGWMASQKAAELEKRMLARIVAERAAFRERRAQRRLRRQQAAQNNPLYEHGEKN